jgi:predicted lactoylglutathione lyase
MHTPPPHFQVLHVNHISKKKDQQEVIDALGQRNRNKGKQQHNKNNMSRE